MNAQAPFVTHGVRRSGKAVAVVQRFTVQLGQPGAGALTAVQAIAELSARQKIGKRLGAAAVIKAERA